jgi:hypothetical protein
MSKRIILRNTPAGFEQSENDQLAQSGSMAEADAIEIKSSGETKEISAVWSLSVVQISTVR